METQTPAGETSQKNNSWFSDLSWQTAAIVAVLSTLFGGGAGTALVATKAVQAQGMSQDQGDVRYLTRGEAQQWRDARSREIDDFKREMKAEFDKNLKRETFDVFQRTWEERQKNFDAKLDRILENR